jgi:hypothetical protein
MEAETREWIWGGVKHFVKFWISVTMGLVTMPIWVGLSSIGILIWMFNNKKLDQTWAFKTGQRIISRIDEYQSKQ